MVLQSDYCKKCGDIYTNFKYRWCRSCQMSDLNWASGNEKIDEFIQESQLKIDHVDNTVFEWVSYDQFDNIKEVSKNGLITMYSAAWRDGPLCYKKRKWTRMLNKSVTLKCLSNSQNNINGLLKEV